MFVGVIASNCAGERRPSVECRGRRLKETSMYSKTSLGSSALDGQLRPRLHPVRNRVVERNPSP